MRLMRHNLQAKLLSTFNRRRLPEHFETQIDETWNERVRKNPTIWNGTKFRIESVVEMNNSVTFNLGITSYKEFIGTNWSPSAELYRQLGVADHCDSQVYMSDALGVGAFLETADGQVVLLKRGEHLAEAPGLWDIPGGHPEPKELVGKIDMSEIDVEQLVPEDVVAEIFNSTLAEIVNEVNIPLSFLSDPILLGIARNTTSAGRPSSEYYVQCSLDSADIRRRYSEGTQAEADETTGIMFVPRSTIGKLQSEQPSFWAQLAPSAKGCLMLYCQH